MARQTINIGTVANDGTGDTIRDSFGKVNTNFQEPLFGLWNYDNALPVQNITATTWTKVLNDGAGGNTYLGGALSGVNIYDTVNSEFLYSDLSLYDSIDYRFDANVTTSSNNQFVQVRLVLSVGVLNIPLTFIFKIYKTTGTFPLFGFVQSQIFTDAVRLNPADIEIYSDDALTLDVNGWSVKVSKRIP